MRHGTRGEGSAGMKGLWNTRPASAVPLCILAMLMASCTGDRPTFPAQDAPGVRAESMPGIAVAAALPPSGQGRVDTGSAHPAAVLQPDGFHFGEYVQHVRVEVRDDGNTHFPVIYDSIVSGDFNGDGRADIVALVSSMSVLDVYLQRGDGSFGAPVVYRYADSDVLSPGLEILVGDFNGDGVDDVAFHLIRTGTMLGSVGLLLSRRGNPPRLHVGYPELYEGVISSGYWTALDADGDGLLDLVLGRAHAGAPSGAYVQVLHGDGTGNFARPAWMQVASDGFAGKVLATDMDNDGRPDLVVEVLEEHPERRKGRIVALHGRPGGGLSATPRELFGFLAWLDTPEFGDIDGNGWKDAVFGDLIYLQVEKERFEGPYVLAMGSGYPYTPLLADVDGDGRTDLVNHQFRGYFTTPFLSVYLQRNDTLEEAFRIPDPAWNHAFRVSQGFHPYATGDFNNDGCQDIAIAVGYDGLALLPGYECLDRLRPPFMSTPLPPSRMP